MKLKIERAALARALGHVQSVVERRNTIPILSNVLLRAEDGVLSLSATDMDIEIVESIAANVTRLGSTTVVAHTFYDIVRKLPDGAMIELDCTAAESGLTIRAGRSTFRLGCLPVDDFPQMAGSELPHRLSLSVDDLRSLIDRTRFAISTEETRYYLNGIYFHAAHSGEVDVLRAVATDGHRLARVEMPLPDGASNMPGVIIPRKTVLELRKLIDEAAGRIEVNLSDSKIRFMIDHIELTSKLIDGSFPDYERVIPTNNNRVMEVHPKDLSAAVDRVATIATEKSRAIKLKMERGQLMLSASSAEAGSASEELEVRYDAEPMEIGFNSRYLLDITAQLEGEGCRFVLADAASPTVIQDAADRSALYVLMPMRV